MKRILDPVHGYIEIPDNYIREIVDTEYFQRLRRIEQTSTRSIFPSARHDRFIHSLGVYHIGSLISRQLRKSLSDAGKDTNEIDILCNTYNIACLLHDCGHAPFSHTFEKYFGTKKELSDQLEEIMIDDKSFSADLTERIEDVNEHEYLSAILVKKVFSEKINNLGGRVNLIVRMIVGCPYHNTKFSVENCLISLLNGGVIDADRVDYACRDVWASGYCTSAIDIRRLVYSINIKKDNDGKYQVCFHNSAMNEIENVLNVKDFQNKYVLNHHTVKYEQYLLDMAVGQMALHLDGTLKSPEEESHDSDTLNQALKKLFDPKKLWETVVCDNYSFRNFSDDDLVFLMKQFAENRYIKEWLSRSYTKFPVWKTKAEFSHLFPKIDDEKKIKDCFDKCKESIIKNIKCPEEDIILCKANFKHRTRRDNMYILLGDEVVPFNEIYKVSDSEEPEFFFYAFVDKKFENETKKEIIKCLQEAFNSIG